MNVEARERALLALIEEERDRECRNLLEAARGEASRSVARAFRQERARLHERVLAERAEARARIQAAGAERDTYERAGHERARERLLALAWPRLRETLLARWADPKVRRAWISNALDQARRVLPPGTWRLRHAPGIAESELADLGLELARELGAEPRVETDASLSAGLAIESDGAVLDASLNALLEDRDAIEARLLALIEGAVPKAGGTPPSVHSNAGLRARGLANPEELP